MSTTPLWQVWIPVGHQNGKLVLAPVEITHEEYMALLGKSAPQEERFREIGNMLFGPPPEYLTDAWNWITGQLFKAE